MNWGWLANSTVTRRRLQRTDRRRLGRTDPAQAGHARWRPDPTAHATGRILGATGTRTRDTDTVLWGPDRLRIGPWRGDAQVALMVPAPGHVPSAETIGRCLELLADRGYRSVLTSALTHGEQQPFLSVSFAVHERLHLLRHDLRDLPEVPRPGDLRLRRGRRRDVTAVLSVDASAFSRFWRFDRAGLDDARSATPAVRWRVGDDGEVVGYAVTGRAGPVAYLQRLAVRPDRQHEGIGTALVIDALQWARRHGATTVLVNTQESNAEALVLYRHLGFTLEDHGLTVLRRSIDAVGGSG